MLVTSREYHTFDYPHYVPIDCGIQTVQICLDHLRSKFISTHQIYSNLLHNHAAKMGTQNSIVFPHAYQYIYIIYIYIFNIYIYILYIKIYTVYTLNPFFGKACPMFKHIQMEDWVSTNLLLSNKWCSQGATPQLLAIGPADLLRAQIRNQD